LSEVEYFSERKAVSFEAKQEIICFQSRRILFYRRNE